MSNENRYIRINNDSWDDAGAIYKVNEYNRLNLFSTGVRLVLEDREGNVIRKVVPSHYIEWVDADFTKD